jgi:excisionase family DNA binding protein
MTEPGNTEPTPARLGVTVTTDTRLLTYQDAASLLGVRPRTVRALAESHRLAVVKIGSLVRIEPAALEAYVASRRVPAKESTAK